MRLVVVFGVVLLLVMAGGCDENKTPPPPEYSGNVTVNRTNGMATSIQVDMPRVLTVSNRREAMALMSQLESIMGDLKNATDQFPVDERKEIKK